MVPTLVSEATFKEDPSLGPIKPPVRESLVAIEFVDEIVGGGVVRSRRAALSQRLNSSTDCFEPRVDRRVDRVDRVDRVCE